MPDSQVFVCPPGVRHYFKEMRAKSKAPGPPFRFFSRCTKCTAILQQVINEKTDSDGNILPVVSAHIIASNGAIFRVKSDIQKTDQDRQ